jgi:hypothetical protein
VAGNLDWPEAYVDNAWTIGANYFWARLHPPGSIAPQCWVMDHPRARPSLRRPARGLRCVSAMAKPRRIHLASRCYVRGWADNGRVFVQDGDFSLEPEPRTVASVGWRNTWWGADAQLSAAAEARLQRVEDAAAPILREIAPRWPLSRDDRATIAQFMAIHTVRTPAWLDTYAAISMEAISEELRRGRWNEEVEKAAVKRFLGDRLRVETLLKQIPRVGSVFMSMQWSLVRFADPLIASCDQPVIFVPHVSSGRHPIQPMPRRGFMETAEVRFPIDPWHVLLLSWSPQPDNIDLARGEFRHAADVNRTTLAQADRHWFHRPGRRPPLLSPPMLDFSCEPISYDLVPNYSFEAAAISRRRSEADKLMKALIESQVTDAMRFVVVT